MTSILFVCLGNICRSPAAEEIMRQMVLRDKKHSETYIRSCGLAGCWEGKPPDERMCEAAQKRGLKLTSRAQKMSFSFVEKFDLIFAADKSVLNQLYQYTTTPEDRAKLHLMTHFSQCYSGKDVPDPYYTGDAGFEYVLDMLEDSCKGILNHVGELQTKE